MLYSRELQFLRDTFKKNHIDSYILTPDTPVSSVLDDSLSAMLGQEITSRTLRDLVVDVAEKTLYRHTDPIGLCFSYLVLPSLGDKKDEILLIGPYFLSEPMAVVRDIFSRFCVGK